MIAFDTLPALTFAQAAHASIPAPDFVLGPLQPGDLGILSGADGSGKSFAALSLGATVAFGLPAAGLVDVPEKTGRVLYAAGEDRVNDHLRRMQRLAAYMHDEQGFDPDAEPDALTVWPLRGERMPLVEPLRDGGYRVTETGEELARRIADFRLVILDPLRMFHDLQEVDGPGLDYLARWLVTVAMKNQQAILLIHHASQGAILDGRDDQHAGRGATDLPAACRAAWTLRAMTQKEAEALETRACAATGGCSSIPRRRTQARQKSGGSVATGAVGCGSRTN